MEDVNSLMKIRIDKIKEIKDDLGINPFPYKYEVTHYSEEIMNKAQSLKGVLDPFSTEGNLGLLKRAGFVDVMTVMKYVCFEGFLAIK